MAHRDPVVDGDGVELLGDAAGLLDLPRHQLAEVLQVDVAGHERGAGTNGVNEFEIAMIALPRSSPFKPVARHGPRAPAVLRP
jgi:hypothetical protein